ncbi:MAG: hypothetical protein EHM49_00695 [Deltaproteobacteria bacterium]|nr:MAG: hypothetical protein EHM49_00695 [Deltaproteobacteria bacterium]
MRKLILILILLLFSPVYAETFVWEHNCTNTVGFKLYQNGVLIADVLCPDLAVTLREVREDRYVVKAYNSNGESDPSNEYLYVAYYYNSMRFDYDSSGNILYKGEHTDQNASVDDVNWIISKYFYSGSMIIQVRVRTTSWTDRVIGW